MTKSSKSVVLNKPTTASTGRIDYAEQVKPNGLISSDERGDELARKEKKELAHKGEHHAPDIGSDLKDHVLLSLLGIAVIAFALGTAVITRYSEIQGYFTPNMVKYAGYAEWALLLAGVATTIVLALGLVFTSAVSVVQKILLAWRGLRKVWFRS